ncbi:broad specificity phosphatase PhoE [Chitinophaga terrae (ex Kim and Jung 2007)]|uniref:histidine phosphatase family protein n=1 Tax=Chitinophaga terrae (ex Kim and Jung 2007) TaxID=408074 RepID=UPI002786FCF5|nr:histidine phosphatase family protein [Chitinophaga terrae (ex Kim and Jung 2007)]MDQ0108189.1 broad specificity phosphatase PhoE [Chitinophaga terrae (ex Kim and Jung 2007)]
MRILTAILTAVMVWAIGCQPAPASKTQVPVAEDSIFLTGTFFIVRHAERNPGEDSTLTPAGRHRAGALYNLLKDSLISKIYFTPYKRSIETADSLRYYLHTDTSFYQADTSGENLVYQLTRHNDWGKRILIIGHSNTIIPILRSLKVEGPLSPIHENDYNRLYRVKMSHTGTELTESCYE